MCNRRKIGTWDLLLWAVFICTQAIAQPTNFSVAYYADEQGLHQSANLKIMQDRKGFIWLASYDGLIRFDGYRFEPVLPCAPDSLHLQSNRVTELMEDSIGRIWLKSNLQEAYCFIPQTHRFWSPLSLPTFKNKSFRLTEFKATPNGRTWLLTDKDGCVCVPDSSLSSVYIDVPRLLPLATRVHDVFESKNGTTWLMTNAGMVHIDAKYFQGNGQGDNNVPTVVIAGNAFVSAVDVGDETWFGGGEGKIWRCSHKSMRFEQLDLGFSSDVTHLSVIPGNRLLAVSLHDGFVVCDLSTEATKVYNAHCVRGFYTQNLSLLLVDAPWRFWFVNNHKGIGVFDFGLEKVTFFPSLIDDATFGNYIPGALVVKDREGGTWVQPKGGGFSYFDIVQNKLLPMGALNVKTSKAEAPVVYSACFDKQNNLWFYANRMRGIGKCTFLPKRFERFAVNPKGTETANNVRTIVQDGMGRVWVATKEESTLSVFDSNYHFLGYLSEQGHLGKMANWKSPVYCVLNDNQGRIWVGTKGNGIFRFTPTSQKNSYDVQCFVHHPNLRSSLSNDNIYAMHQDKSGRIWIGTWGGGLNLVDERNGNTAFIHHGNGLSSFPMDKYNRIRCIAEDNNGLLYLGTINGLLCAQKKTGLPENIDFKQLSYFDNLDVMAVVPHWNDELFVTTYNGQLHRMEKRDAKGFPHLFKRFTTTESRLSGAILAVCPDKKGNLWLCAEGGMARFNTQTETFESFPETKHILANHVFSEAAIWALNNGQIWAGFSNGIIRFSPDSLSANQFKPYLALTGFQLFGRSDTGRDNADPFQAIDQTEEVVLSHRQNFFKISFAALDFASKGQLQYKYKLEGLEEAWNLANDERSATYTNISKGEYVFRVVSTNANGIWTDNERQLKIIVKPAIWETYLAYVCYLLAVFAMVALILRVRMTVFRLRHEARAQHQLAEMKMDLFTDVSHEIRTPLTLVAAPVDYLLGQPDTPSSVKTQLATVAQNTQRLLRLVNQILDIRKLEVVPLRVEPIDLGHFARSVCADFDGLAKQGDILLNLDLPAAPMVVWADRDGLDKMMVNLLSNALKYSLQGSMVTVAVKGNEGHYILKVTDNGTGISPEQRSRLFQRFVGFNTDKGKNSSGIGLSLVKELADRHGAQVLVYSEPGKGSEFSIVFQKGNTHFSKDVEMVVESENITAGGNGLESRWDIYESATGRGTGKPVGLIVEDDEKLRHFMTEILVEHFDLHEAADGQEGFKKAMLLNPDFIVSDIMMPNKDGIELLCDLRKEVSTSHIPIVLLTAKADVESKIEGLSHGADDYLTKPFGVSYFRARIHNLLAQRKRLHEYYKMGLASIASSDEPHVPLISEHDKMMMEKVVDFINANIESEQLSVDELGKAAGLSRTTFFNKLKSLTGLSPVEFIRDQRLKRAAHLMAVDKMLVKEACFQAGFSDLKYFGSCFKVKFGMTPSEYRTKFKG